MAQIGIIGLGVMGANIARNFASKGIVTSVYNRSSEKTDALLQEHGNEFLQGHANLADFLVSLEKPRKILLMVTAGAPVDAVLEALTSLLAPGDIVIDGGNSLFSDTQRRTAQLAKAGIHYIGMGISGGEEGALHGPSMMAGIGNELGQQGMASDMVLKELLEKATARDFTNGPCLGWFGGAGSGHYVKMIHNGIEYAIMELIAETYQLLRKAYQLSPDQIAQLFAQWQKGKLNSYLIDITAQVLAKKDDFGDGFLIDKIKDQAGQKGTGQWTVQDAFSRGIPVPSIVTAVEARQISSFRSIRVRLAQQYPFGKNNSIQLPPYEQLEDMLFSGIVLCYIQGLTLIATTAKEQSWHIDLSEVIRIWQGGCIIRATLLTNISNWLKNISAEQHLLEIPAVKEILLPYMSLWPEYLNMAMVCHVPLMGYQASYQYLLAMTEEQCSANLIQGLRDFFGAHTYERLDKEGIFHTVWE